MVLLIVILLLQVVYNLSYKFYLLHDIHAIRCVFVGRKPWKRII